MFALVFFTQSRTKDVVPISAIPAGAECGDVARVRHGGRQYKAKILHIGAKEMCELKATAVTREGSLLEDDFDVTAPTGYDIEDDDDDDDDDVFEAARMRKSQSEKDCCYLQVVWENSFIRA